jgi:hypothetical protein
LVSGLAAAISCAPLRTTSPVEHTMSAFVVYTPADIVPGASLQGEAVDVIAVRGGEIVRLAVRQARDLEIGELASTAAGRSAESWSRVAPRPGSSGCGRWPSRTRSFCRVAA